jgi:citronellol/citronellal dehydrogenase
LSGYSSIFRDLLFSGQLCVVTGGGSGIGRCNAHELPALGAQVVLLGRQKPKLELSKPPAVLDGEAEHR